MPKAPKVNRENANDAKPQTKELSTRTHTRESTAYLKGLFGAFSEQVTSYNNQTDKLLQIEACIELSEKQLVLARDHLAMTIERTQGAVPHDWEEILRSVRFVGVRLADACAVLLQESNNKKLTPEELLDQLNNGMFRFRTNAPLREIHAALLKQSSVKRSGAYWIWLGQNEQLPLRLRVVKASRPTTIEGEKIAG
jgi:hypothetical protein